MSLANVLFPDPSGPRIATGESRSIRMLRSLISGLPGRYEKETEKRLIMGGRDSAGFAQTNELFREGRVAGPFDVLGCRESTRSGYVAPAI